MDEFGKQYDITKAARKAASLAAFKFGRESDEFRAAKAIHADALAHLKKIVVENEIFFPVNGWAAVL